MRRKGIPMAFSICGSVIGAGFASGREISTFFARFGVYSPAAMAAAVAAIAFFTARILRAPGLGGMPLAWQGTRLESCWHTLFLLLMIATSGAMLAGSSEIAALMLPVPSAQPLGLLVTLAAALLFARKRCILLPAASAALTLCLVGMLVLGLTLPPTPGVRLSQNSALLRAAVSGLCYGGLNMALAVPAAADGLPDVHARKTAVRSTAALLGILLFMGNALLLRHPQIMSSPMPLMMLLGSHSLFAYRLCGATMYLAMFTTLLAALKGLRALCPGRPTLYRTALAGMLIIAFTGFVQLVDFLYPLLGFLCFILLAWRAVPIHAMV